MPGRVGDELREQQELEQQIELDRRAQERAGATAPNIGLTSPGYVRARHPHIADTEVTFVPGELLPDWAADALRAGTGKPTPDGHIVLEVGARSK
jgi:hypothetical protein